MRNFRSSVVFIIIGSIFLASDYFFDFSESQWHSRLPERERIHLDSITLELGKLYKEGAPWPTFVEFKDGRVGLVLTKDGLGTLLLTKNGCGTPIIQHEELSLLFGSQKKRYEVGWIVYPNDYRNGGDRKKFFCQP